MIPWQALTGWTGTSLMNLGIAAGLFAAFDPGYFTIICRLGWDDDAAVVGPPPAPPQIFAIAPQPEPSIVPQLEGPSQPCATQPPLDRLPAAIAFLPGAEGPGHKGSACLLVGTTGRVERVAHASSPSARRMIAPMASNLRFQPAVRHGRPVSAWVEFRL